MSRISNIMNKSRTNKSQIEPEVKPFPELSLEEQDKLFNMFEELLQLHGKCYSELTINQKRLVEFFCMRTAVNSRGISPGTGEKAYRVLRLGAYSHKFIVKALNEWFNNPLVSAFHIIEDDQLNYVELYGNPYRYTGSPYHDGLKSFPDNYLPIRDSKSRGEIWAVWLGGKGSKHSQLESYLYKKREYTLKNEIEFQSLPLYMPIIKEEKIIVEEPIIIHHPDITYLLEMQVKEEVDEKVAELAKEFFNNMEEFHKKYDTKYKPTYSYAKKVREYLEN